MLGEQLDLAHLLLPRHEALVEEPAEPFEIALAAECLELLDLPFYLVDGAGERVFGLAIPFDGPFGLRQHGRRRVFFRVFRQAECLGKTEAIEVMVKAGEVSVAKQRHRLLLCAAEMDGAEGADALAEPELATALCRHLPVEPAQAQEIGRVGDEDPRDDTRPRGRADRVLADRERLENRRMGILIWFRHHADLADDALLVDLAGGAVSAGPFGNRPAPDALLIRKRDFVVLAVVFPALRSTPS